MNGTKSFLTWRDRLESGQLTKSEINQFSHAITRIARGLMPHGRRITLDTAEAIELVHKINRDPVQLTNEHTTQGLLWFGRHAEKALGMPGAMVLDIINHFDHFSWDGEVHLYGVYGNGEVPVWTVHLDDKRELRYHYAPWVEGVNESGYEWIEGP